MPVQIEMMPVETEWTAVVRPNDRFSDPQLGRAPFWIAKTEMTWDLYDTFVFGLDQPAAPVPRPPQPMNPRRMESSPRAYAQVGAISAPAEATAAVVLTHSRRVRLPA